MGKVCSICGAVKTKTECAACKKVYNQNYAKMLRERKIEIRTGKKPEARKCRRGHDSYKNQTCLKCKNMMRRKRYEEDPEKKAKDFAALEKFTKERSERRKALRGDEEEVLTEKQIARIKWEARITAQKALAKLKQRMVA